MIVTANPNSGLNAQPNLINHFVKIWLGVESINSNPFIRSQRPTKSNQSFRQKMPCRRPGQKKTKTIDDKVNSYLKGQKGKDYVIANNGETETKTKILQLRQNIFGETFQHQVADFNTWLMNWWSMTGNQWHDFDLNIFKYIDARQFDFGEVNCLTILLCAICCIQNLKLVTGLLNLEQNYWLEYWLDRLRKHVCTVIYLAVKYNPRSNGSKAIEEM